jgi:hypothetical protein
MSKQPGRLFTFGCSMTSYHWPTWADILGRQWEYFENWAEPGGGNPFIFDSVIECDARNKFTPEDQVLVMWSGLARIDYYQQNRWGHWINSFAKDKSTLPYSCPDGYEILSYPLFAALDQYLKSKNLNYKLFSFMSYDTVSKAGSVYKDILNKIEHIKFELIPTPIKELGRTTEVILLYERLHGKDWPPLDKILEKNYNALNEEIEKELQEFIAIVESEPHYRLTSIDKIDYHPLPLDHYNMIKHIAPDLTIERSTVEWLSDINTKIKNGQLYRFDRFLPKERF